MVCAYNRENNKNKPRIHISTKQYISLYQTDDVFADGISPIKWCGIIYRWTHSVWFYYYENFVFHKENEFSWKNIWEIWLSIIWTFWLFPIIHTLQHNYSWILFFNSLKSLVFNILMCHKRFSFKRKKRYKTIVVLIKYLCFYFTEYT